MTMEAVISKLTVQKIAMVASPGKYIMDGDKEPFVEFMVDVCGVLSFLMKIYF